MGTLIDRFEEHDGPVRGVDFVRTTESTVTVGNGADRDNTAQNATNVRVWRGRLQDQSVVAADATLNRNAGRTSRLRPHCILPPRGQDYAVSAVVL